MGVWKVGKNVSLDLDSLRIVKWGKELHSPMFDAERSDSLFFRFVLRQWETFIRAGLAMPAIMQAVVKVNQQLQPAKSCQSILEFPVAHVTGETDGLAICKGDAGPFPMKRSANRLWIHLRAVADVAPEAYRSPFSQRSYMARRVA